MSRRRAGYYYPLSLRGLVRAYVDLYWLWVRLTTVVAPLGWMWSHGMMPGSRAWQVMTELRRDAMVAR